MIADLKPYPEYKESGIPWIGSVPSDWRVERTKCIFRSRKELNVGRQNTNVLSLTLRGVVNNDPESPEGMVPKDYATYQLFKKHDLVFKLIDLENIRTSRVGLVHEDGIMSSAYVRLAPTKSVNIRFFYLQFFDLYTRAVFNALGAGVRSTLGAADLGELRIVIPRPAEQAAIVRFLDRWNGRLEKAIRAKRRVIALLQEQKQAIIHRSVTKGLDPNVNLKDSAIPWLGEIPAHWGTPRLAQLSTRIGDGLHGTPEYVDHSPYHFINGNNLVNGCIRLKASTRCVGLAAYNKHAVSLGESTLLMSINGTIGNVALYQGESVILGKSAAYINCNRNLTREYLLCFLQSPTVVNFLRQEVTGTTIFNLSLASIRGLFIALPPIDEQHHIVESIEKNTAPLTSAITRYEREITLLQEYRTRLTADVVTGKLDVRAAAAQLPDPEEEPTELEAPEEETELEEVEG
jgi:type I restriction enzyme, S subunit